jgi:hypothetical protein
MKKQFRKLLLEMEYHVLYMEKYIAHATNINNLVIASGLLVSGTGIAGWALWQQFPWAWSIIIGLGQVLQIIKPFLPYTKRIDVLSEMYFDVKDIETDMEKAWQANERLKEKADWSKVSEFKERYEAIQRRRNVVYIPTINHLDKTAAKKSRMYINSFCADSKANIETVSSSTIQGNALNIHSLPPPAIPKIVIRNAGKFPSIRGQVKSLIKPSELSDISFEDTAQVSDQSYSFLPPFRDDINPE